MGRTSLSSLVWGPINIAITGKRILILEEWLQHSQIKDFRLNGCFSEFLLPISLYLNPKIAIIHIHTKFK